MDKPIASGDAKIEFLSFCIEQYKREHHLSGVEVIELFEKEAVVQYLTEGFEVLHTQGRDWIIDDIDKNIQNRRK